jgi:phosphate transport system permease protein
MDDRRSKIESGSYPEGRELQTFVDRRQRTGQIWKTAFLGATVVGIIALLALLYNVINESFGYVAWQNQIDPSTLTLNFYKEQVLGAQRTFTSEDDAKLVQGIQDRSTAIGFFGYSYYNANQDGLKLLAVDGVRPSAETVATEQYSLTRPLYVYSAESVLLEKRQVASFLSYYLQHANADPVALGFFPAPPPLVEDSVRTLEAAAGQGILPPAEASGEIAAAGSSTVAPLTQSAAEAFKAAGFAGNVTVDISGTAAGFEAFCAGEADIVNASRAANRDEILKCRKAGRPLVEFRVGTDGLAVVTSSQNDFLDSVSNAQLQEIFTTGDRWSQIDAAWADKPILHYIPGTESGTLDFFVSTVFPSSLEEMPTADKITVLTANISSGRARALAATQLFEERTDADLVQLLTDEVVKPRIAATWNLVDSIFNKAAIEEEALLIPNSSLQFRNWVNPTFVTSPQSSKPEYAGVRTAIIGSLWVTLIAFLFSVPLGVGAAIYLEEYGGNSRVAQIIETNINNLAGVPSIIYGMLGLAVFVRVLEGLTSGRVFGVVDPTTANGRTVLSAGLTLGLLILPLVIINAREAIRAVPNSLREAGYGLGATKWQTIRAHVLPNAIPGILTGVILAVSRALGETAPLVVIGASTFIVIDPNGPFSKFTTLPIQIYQWTSRPQPEFQSLAAAAILVLLVLLLAMNATAILLRNKYARSY